MRENESVLASVRQVVNPMLLALLLCTDGVFILIHVLNELSGSPRDLLSVGKDRGYPEVFQYIKEFWIALLLVAVWWRTRERIYGTWALLVAYLLCDDAVSVHERLGQQAAIYWDFAPFVGLRARDFGELAVSLAAGSAFLVPLTYYYLRSSNEARIASKNLLFLLAILVFFGVFFDMVDIAVETFVPLKGMDVIEDGGEMVTMSVITSYVAHLQQRQVDGSISFWQQATAALRGHWRPRVLKRKASRHVR